jgi:polysaccharide deacetylase family protein (PEP-CTERM system associated)
MDKQADIINSLSFDLEEWFHAEVFSSLIPSGEWEAMESRCEKQTDLVLRLLEEHGVRATFFALGWLAERYPSLVKRIAASGHELACHGYDHTMITRQRRDEFDGDVKRSKKLLEDLCGKEIKGYRAPTFSITGRTGWALEVLLENGFHYDSSIYPIRHDRYGIPGAPRFPYVALMRDGRSLWEFPGPTVCACRLTLPAAGGGYLRLFPYAWTRRAMLAAHSTGQPVNVYAHPWEFDCGLPRVELPLVARFRHYGGIKDNASKLKRLFGEFRFAPMGEVIASIVQNTESRENIFCT